MGEAHVCKFLPVVEPVIASDTGRVPSAGLAQTAQEISSLDSDEVSPRLTTSRGAVLAGRLS